MNDSPQRIRQPVSIGASMSMMAARMSELIALMGAGMYALGVLIPIRVQDATSVAWL